MRHGWVTTGIVAVLALVSACATAPRHTPAPKKSDTAGGTPYDFRQEGKIPPPASDAPVEADVVEIPLADSSLDVTEAEAPPPDTLQAPVVPDSTVEGFRVQVFASSDRQVAEGAASVAEERLGVKAYVDLDGGMYKVRVGDYRTRRDAEAAMATMRKHYYPDAWIVPGMVRVPRKP